MPRIRKAYTTHKASAKQRGIPFLLSFDEWHSIWISSGRLDERGYLRGQYVMARFGDQGAYAIGNVQIITGAENTAIANRRTKAKLTPEIVREIRRMHIKRSRMECGTKGLARRYGVALTTIKNIVRGISWKNAE